MGAELSARAVVLKGKSMYNKNEFNKAAQYFKRATILYARIKKYGIPAFEGLINSYKKLGLTEQASEAQRKFAELYPNAQK
jgi:tetratricopeptide (TPR) repeat protein